mmetsp:Transcript_21347/g.33027  ORF Transcript_21347/g.33027 Transcript_21347/m.33027 type:complete len:93 (-) Transcript_21347:1622-1900(-)
MALDRPQNARERLSVEPEQLAALRAHPDAEGSLLVVYQSQLSEVLSRFQLSHVNEARLIAYLVELEALYLAGFYDEEFLAILAFVEDELVLA